jgi:hypothetical protein
LFENERVRSAVDWWEIAVLILLIEAPDIPSTLLGAPEEIFCGEWSKPSESVFNHRDGMRDYLESGFGFEPSEVEDGWRRYRNMTNRVVKFLMALLGTFGEFEKHPPVDTRAHSKKKPGKLRGPKRVYDQHKDRKLISAHQASGVTQIEFERNRADLKEGDIRRAKDRERSHSRKRCQRP